jgi:orotidine-5'-phosphate decarboxylase
MRFGERLSAAVAEHGPLCVGIDPHSELLSDWGLTDDAGGVQRFCRTVVDALAGEVALIKPQSAFFERHGSRGVAALEALLADARAAGILVLLDVKRGDIGTTMGGYAQAYLGAGSPLSADAITVSPYLGFGSLDPALELAAKNGRGVFVLARTSNPEGASIQEARAGDRSVAQTVVDEVAARNAGLEPLGDVGVVVGATGEYDLDLSGLNGAVLAPGLGAQGATPADIAARFTRVGGIVVPTASRSVLRHGPPAAGLRAAVARLRDELAGAGAQR